MQGSELKALRKLARFKQAEAADAVGISAAYWGELERGEKAIDIRMAQRINAALRTRIDVAYSEALAGWTVSITKTLPANGGTPGRSHAVVGKYDTTEEATRRAADIMAADEPTAHVVVYPKREGPPSTTNPSCL